jgi:hypothetical protein
MEASHILTLATSTPRLELLVLIGAGVFEPKKLLVCDTDKCYVTMSKIEPLSSISQLGMLLVLCV